MVYPYNSIELNGRRITLADVVERKESGETPFERETLAFIAAWLAGQEEFSLKTSGSTGPPKTVTITRNQMAASAAATLKALEIRSGQTAFVCLDTKYIAGKMMLVRALSGGLKIIAREPVGNPLASVSFDCPIDFAALVPYQLEQILNSARRDFLDRIGTIIIGGASIPQQIIPQLSQHRTRFFSTYGMTETVSHIALCDIRHTTEYTILPGIEIYIDERRCLVIRAPYLEEPVHTNDLVELTSASTFKLLGRIDNIINTGGVKISPEDVERTLENVKNEINLHGRFIISSLPDRSLGEAVVCVIEGESGIPGESDILLAKISTHVGKFERPRSLIYLERFPETPTGKVDRQAIVRQLREKHRNPEGNKH